MDEFVKVTLHDELTLDVLKGIKDDILYCKKTVDKITGLCETCELYSSRESMADDVIDYLSDIKGVMSRIEEFFNNLVDKNSDLVLYWAICDMKNSVEKLESLYVATKLGDALEKTLQNNS